MVSHQIGLDETNSGLGVESVGALRRRLLCRLDLGKVLFHARELGEDGVCLCVYALKAKSILERCQWNCDLEDEEGCTD